MLQIHRGENARMPDGSQGGSGGNVTKSKRRQTCFRFQNFFWIQAMEWKEFPSSRTNKMHLKTLEMWFGTFLCAKAWDKGDLWFWSKLGLSSLSFSYLTYLLTRLTIPDQRSKTLWSNAKEDRQAKTHANAWKRYLRTWMHPFPLSKWGSRRFGARRYILSLFLDPQVRISK